MFQDFQDFCQDGSYKAQKALISISVLFRCDVPFYISDGDIQLCKSIKDIIKNSKYHCLDVEVILSSPFGYTILSFWITESSTLYNC